MKLFHRVPPLDAPKQPDEVEFTPLQLTRMRWTAINFQNIAIIGIVIMWLAAAIVMVALWWDGFNDERRQCESTARARTELRATFEDLYDGFVASTANDPVRHAAAVQFKDERMRRLKKALPIPNC